jgi:hypothetical protein
MTTRYCAALATPFIVAFAVLCWLISPHSPRDLALIFTPEHVSFLAMHDNSDQQRSYRIVVIAVAFVSLVGAFVYGRTWPSRSVIGRRLEHVVSGVDAWGSVLVAVVVAILLHFYFHALPVSSYPVLHADTFVMTFLPSPRIYVAGLAGTLIVVLLIGKFANELTHSPLRRTIWAGIVAYAVFLMLPGLVETPNFCRFSGELLTAVEWHYAGGLGPADRLAAGQRLFSEVQLYSGPLLVTLLATAERALGPFSMGGHIRIVQALQIVFLIATLVALWRWNRSRPLAILLAFLLVAPWIHTYHSAVLFPNQSAWRSLGLPLGLLALLILGPRQTVASRIALGTGAGLLVLSNIETGLCVTAGYVVFLIVTLTPRSFAQTVRIAASFCIGLTLAVLGFLLLFRAGLGYWPIPPSLPDLLLLIVRFSSGYAGLQFTTIEPFPLLVCLHAIYLTFRSTLQCARGPLPFRWGFKAAVATITLLWFAYYVKGPHFWNFWTFLFLYGFLVGDYLDGRLLSALWRRLPRVSYSWRPLVLGLVILPTILFTNLGAIFAVSQGLSRLMTPSRCVGLVVSRVQLPANLAKALLSKATVLEALRGRHPGRNVVYFTANSYMLPLVTGFYSRLPFQDTFFETITNDDFEHLVASTMALSPDVVLFDTPGTLLAGYPDQQHFFGRLRAALAGSYVLTRTTDGWDVWEPTVRVASQSGRL